MGKGKSEREVLGLTAEGNATDREPGAARGCGPDRDGWAMTDNARGARIVEVIEVETFEGEGVPNDPGRIVHRYYNRDGELLAKRDGWAENHETFISDAELKRLRGIERDLNSIAAKAGYAGRTVDSAAACLIHDVRRLRALEARPLTSQVTRAELRERIGEACTSIITDRTSSEFDKGVCAAQRAVLDEIDSIPDASPERAEG